MTRLALRRLVQLPLILLVIYTITFVLAWMIPGNPLQHGEGRQPPPEIMQAMTEQYRLDRPLAFYWDYLGDATGVNWLRGKAEQVFDLGPSLRHTNWSVNEILHSGLPVSITLGLTAILLALLLGLPLGILGSRRPGAWSDRATLVLSLVGVSIPTFVIGTGLLMLGGVHWHLLPIGGWGTPRHLVLPALTLSLPFAAYIARLTREGMIEQMSTPHILAARARGLGEWAVTRHALKNALLPVVSYLGPASAMAMTGSFVVEKVFAVPGIGVHFVDAVLSKDLTLIMGIVLSYATILVLMNLCVDMLYAWVDPRIELHGAGTGVLG